MNGQLFNGLINALTNIQGRAVDAHKLLVKRATSPTRSPTAWAN